MNEMSLTGEINQPCLEPYFSVIIATYNRVSFVFEALESVASQTFKNFEIIVCDDGSTDNSYERIEEIYKNRVRLIRTPHVGPAGARNAAIQCAAGKYIAFLDSDDLWAPWALECAYEVTQAIHGPLIAYLVPTYILYNTQLPHFFREKLNSRVFDSYFHTPLRTVCGSGMIVAASRDVLSRVGGFSEKMRNGEDRDLALRLGSQVKVVIVEKPKLLVCREHDSQMTKSLDHAIQGWLIIEENYRKGIYGDVGNDVQLTNKMLQHFIGWALDLPEIDGRWACGLHFYRAAWRCGILSRLYCRPRLFRRHHPRPAWVNFIVKYPIFLFLLMISRQGKKIAANMSSNMKNLIAD